MRFSKDDLFTALPQSRVTKRRDGAIMFRTLDQATASAPFKRAALRIEKERAEKAAALKDATGMSRPPTRTRPRTVRPIAFQLTDADRQRLTALRLQQQTTNEERSHDTDND